MVMSVQNVGGNASGQQANFGAHGSTSNQHGTSADLPITDIAPASAATHLDFEAFEEMTKP